MCWQGENTEIALSADYSKKGTINGMLPSSFFVIEPVYETDDGISTEKAKEAPVVISYTLYGGGFGHGIGMSQNAAREWHRRAMTINKSCNFSMSAA